MTRKCGSWESNFEEKDYYWTLSESLDEIDPLLRIGVFQKIFCVVKSSSLGGHLCVNHGYLKFGKRIKNL